MASTLLQPSYSTDKESHAIMGKIERQQQAYKTASAHSSGRDSAHEAPGQKVWSTGTCLGPVGCCSYNVRINGLVYCRSRRQVVSSKEPPIPEVTETEPVTLEPSSKTSCNPVTQDQEPATTMAGLPFKKGRMRQNVVIF